MADCETKPPQNFKIITPNQERIFTVPGNRGPNDMRIFSEFPKQPWATTLYYVGCILRLKGMVEDRNYPSGFGHAMLAAFILECICHPEIKVIELCKRYKIPLQEKQDELEDQITKPIEIVAKNSLTEALNVFWKEQGW